MIRNLLSALRAPVPQSEPLPGQVPNSAGGHSFAVDDWVRLDRFLVLGAEGGSYYASARTLTLGNAQAVLRCVTADGPRAVARIVELSTSARAPKNDAAIFALAVALKRGDDTTRRIAAGAVAAVCRTGTHLFQLAEAVGELGGWGRGTKRAFADWYLDKPARDLAFQLVKYPSRGGWSHRDVLRLAKPKGATGAHDTLLHYVTRGTTPEGGFAAVDPSLVLVDAVESARSADRAGILRLVVDHALPWETIPSEHLGAPEVWRALLEAGAVPFGALVRNLARLGANGLLVEGSDAVAGVVARLRDPVAVRKARVHPLSVLAALVTYRSGRGARGRGAWTPVPAVVSALDAAFYASFGNVTPTGKRWMLALDVSGSMGWSVLAGFPGITPRVGSAAMAMVTSRVEPACTVTAFTAASGPPLHPGAVSGITPVDIAGRRLDDVVAITGALPMGATDCALPMSYAEKRRLPVDVFVVYTDSETWAGALHPVEALRRYRATMGIPAKLVVVGMVSNGFTIADPKDAGMLDVVGFDTAAPEIMSSFAR